MVIFIDESGTHKESGYAVNAIVYIAIKNIEEVERQLKQILNDLDLDSFHWAEHGWKVRAKFLEKVIKLNFTFKVGVFENPSAKDAKRWYEKLKKEDKLLAEIKF